ncbi:hypothetical protein ACFVAJ_17990 [Agromyces sp. NPDC057679]|uniref:hypothetical protein n=1 Tax=Agromyces sp. NPDC057679 TaxID=3346207 RepID=UPI00366B2C76
MTNTAVLEKPAAATREVVLPFTQKLLDGLFAVSLHSSDEPVLNHVEVTSRHFTATNRHTIGRYEHTTAAEWLHLHGTEFPAAGDASKNPDGVAVLVPRTVVNELVKLTAKKLNIVDLKLLHANQDLEHFPYTVTFTDMSVVVRRGMAGDILWEHGYKRFSLNYPPAWKLMTVTEETLDEPVSFNPEYIAIFARGAAKVNEKNEPMTFRGTTRDGKQGPTLITFGKDRDQAGEVIRFKGLVQPFKERR